VAQAMNSRNFLTTAAAVGGLAFLTTMVVSGALPEQRQLVKFEARGVMKLQPEIISRVELHRAPRKTVLLRAADSRWIAEGGGALSAELSAKLSLAVQFMNTASPIRIIEADELQGTNTRDFGLDPPRLSVVLYQGTQSVIGARFGAHNPEDTAQYMILDGHRDVILMSRFVGQEWEAVANAVFAK
jgi:hypothetical protein